MDGSGSKQLETAGRRFATRYGFDQIHNLGNGALQKLVN